MQSAIDSFYVALRARLVELNPARTVTLDGHSQPAILLAVNQFVTAAKPLEECFYLGFGASSAAQAFADAENPLFSIECAITYSSRGSTFGGSGRGRGLAALDSELLRICKPFSTAKLDYTQSPPQPLGTNVFWSQLRLQEPEELDGTLRRTAALTLFFFPEVSA